MEIELRNERFSDYPETENVVREAFWNRYSPGCYEHYLIHIMRYSRAFVPQLDFVAVFDDKIVGNIVFLKSVKPIPEKNTRFYLWGLFRCCRNIRTWVSGKD